VERAERSPILPGLPVTRIDASRRSLSRAAREIWQAREVLYFLTWRNVKVRYKQTVLGAAWAVLQPLLTMVIFSVFLGHLAKLPADGFPYPLFVYCGLVPWFFFVYSLTEGGNSLLVDEPLLTKVYVPRLIIPLAAILAGLMDFAIGFGLLLALIAYYGIPLTLSAVAIPLFLLLALATCFGVGVWFAALNVQYRDVRYTLMFLTQAWLFATPIVYPSTLVPESLRPLYGLNPMAGVVEGFRWSLLGKTPSTGLVLVSAAVAAVLALTAAIYFRRTERRFADVV
jgi:lipopolysaccharide transport system permease protein